MVLENELPNFPYFFALRLDTHAQYEIRVYAEAMAQIVKEKVPLAWKAFEDYKLNSLEFSGPELLALKEILAGGDGNLESVLPNKRERAEFEEKLKRLR